MQPEKKSVNEQRIRNLAPIYYSRQDIRKNILDFAKHREVSPRYFEGFGKRPDTLSFESDVLELVKKGATSLHCSEEIWQDALELNTAMTEQQLNSLRQGWDLLIDIDSKYFDYSRIYAELLVKILTQQEGIKHLGIKFSVIGKTPVLIRENEKISLIPISEAIELFKKTKNLEILSLGKDKKLKFARIYDSLEHKDNIYEVLHEHSKVPLKVTKHHSVFIFDKGEIIQKKVAEIKKGDYLVTYNSDNNPLLDNPSVINHKFEIKKNQFIKNSFNKKITINQELIRLIGYYLAEGHVTNLINQTGFTFNQNETDYIQDCTKLLRKITNRHISIRHPNAGSTQILIHSKEWASFFEKFCGKAKNKHLPSFSWNLSKDLFLEMLKGYIRGDGYKLGKYSIAVKSVAHQLIKELVWLCKLNGISCSLSTEQSKPHKLTQGNVFKGSFVYILKINKSEKISSEFRKERNKFSPYPRDRTFPINGLKEIYYQIKPKMFNYHRLEHSILRKERANLKRIKKVIEWFKNFKSEEFTERSKYILKNYLLLFNSDIGVIKIKDIKKIAQEKVYDVSVKETEAFFGNDYPVLLHNSGSKGFHLIIPWKAFPEQLSGNQTKDMFPEWPRLICRYLSNKLTNELKERILDLNLNKQETNQDQLEHYCLQCKSKAESTNKIFLQCTTCNTLSEAFEETIKRKRILRCPNCHKEMQEIRRQPIQICQTCNLNSKTSPNNFKERIKTQNIDADIVLVSNRHLFRMPYSLHEKTSLASVVLNPDKIKEFQLKDAHPLKISTPKDFMPNSEPGEATNLLIRAIEAQGTESEQDMYQSVAGKFQNQQNQTGQQQNKQYQGTKKRTDFKEITIHNLTEDLYPPTIKTILKGMKEDGRKRALFILLNYFRTLKVDNEKLEQTILEWNKKNYNPLKSGYIKSQLSWHFKTQPKLPPNYNKPHYKEIGINPTNSELKAKNPVSYTIRISFAKQHSKDRDNKNPSNKNKN